MYLLDANVFIQAKQRTYCFDFCPGFWDWLDRAHGSGRVVSIEAVLSELKAGADDLSDWAGSRVAMFAAVDDRTLESMAKLAGWAGGASLPYSQGAVQDFLDSADFYLVAHADAHGQTVVTHELSSQVGKRRVKIPEACDALGVPYVQPHELLSRERARFVLGP